MSKRCIKRLKQYRPKDIVISDRIKPKLRKRGFREDILKSKLLDTQKILHETCQPEEGTHKFVFKHSRRNDVVLCVAFKRNKVHIATALYENKKRKKRISKQPIFFITKKF